MYNMMCLSCYIYTDLITHVLSLFGLAKISVSHLICHMAFILGLAILQSQRIAR